MYYATSSGVFNGLKAVWAAVLSTWLFTFSRREVSTTIFGSYVGIVHTYGSSQIAARMLNAIYLGLISPAR